jgi:hypothetical protein
MSELYILGAPIYQCIYPKGHIHVLKYSCLYISIQKINATQPQNSYPKVYVNCHLPCGSFYNLNFIPLNPLPHTAEGSIYPLSFP